MRQRLNPWAVVITAALTFGSLLAFVGPHSYGHPGWGRHGHAGQPYRYNHRGCDGRHDRSNDTGDSNLTR